MSQRQLDRSNTIKTELENELDTAKQGKPVDSVAADLIQVLFVKCSDLDDYIYIYIYIYIDVCCSSSSLTVFVSHSHSHSISI